MKEQQILSSNEELHEDINQNEKESNDKDNDSSEFEIEEEKIPSNIISPQ